MNAIIAIPLNSSFNKTSLFFDSETEAQKYFSEPLSHIRKALFAGHVIQGFFLDYDLINKDGFYSDSVKIETNKLAIKMIDKKDTKLFQKIKELEQKEKVLRKLQQQRL